MISPKPWSSSERRGKKRVQPERLLQDVTAVRMRIYERVWFCNEPTGKRVLVDEMMYFRFEEGLLVDRLFNNFQRFGRSMISRSFVSNSG